MSDTCYNPGCDDNKLPGKVLAYSNIPRELFNAAEEIGWDHSRIMNDISQFLENDFRPRDKLVEFITV